MNLKETHLLLLVKKSFTVPKASTGWKTKRGIGIIFFQADNYAIATEILVNKYCVKVKLRASIDETQSSRIVRESRHFPDECLKMFPMQCNKDAGGLFEKVL